MSKAVKSKLDAFTVSLDEWFGLLNLSLEEIKAKLKEDGCEVSISRLSRWWEARQSFLAEEKMLAQISSGASTVKAISAEFEKNAPPQLQLIIPLLRVLILKLSTQANCDPSLIELVVQLMKPVMDYAKIEEKSKDRELEREKFDWLRKDMLEKAMSFLDAELKSLPGGSEIFLEFEAKVKAAREKK